MVLFLNKVNLKVYYYKFELKVKRIVIGFVSFFLLLSCSEEQVQPEVSFYYWKTIFQLNNNEKTILEANKVSKIYVRYFDVSLKDKEAIPLSPVVFKEKKIRYDIVPVVYIKNEVMLEEAVNLENMARNIYTFIAQMNDKNGIRCHEIQIDCDWTLKSKDRYLKFIEDFKKISTKKLSATIRLHQVKYYQKTGIPNVDKGVLMFYNMGSIAPDNLNSIYDRNIAQSYIRSLHKFPLQLDIALPIYSWGIHIRNHKVIKVVGKLDHAELEKDTHFKKTDGMHFTVVESVIRGGNYYEKGDVVKIECITKKDLKTMAEDLKEHIAEQPEDIIFYDLDSFNLKAYNDDEQFFKKVAGWF